MLDLVGNVSVEDDQCGLGFVLFVVVFFPRLTVEYREDKTVIKILQEHASRFFLAIFSPCLAYSFFIPSSICLPLFENNVLFMFGAYNLDRFIVLPNPNAKGYNGIGI